MKFGLAVPVQPMAEFRYLWRKVNVFLFEGGLDEVAPADEDDPSTRCHALRERIGLLLSWLPNF